MSKSNVLVNIRLAINLANLKSFVCIVTRYLQIDFASRVALVIIRVSKDGHLNSMTYYNQIKCTGEHYTCNNFK